MGVARPSRRWGHFRIIAGTLLGGIFGFYVMHRVENSYKVVATKNLDPMLVFRDPVKLKTKSIIFESSFHARDSATLEQLKELSSRRKIIEDSVIGESSMTEAIAREMAGGLTSKIQQDLQKLEGYLPLLENLVSHVESLDTNGKSKICHWVSKLQIRWSSALSESSIFEFGDSKFYKIDKLQLELGLGLYLYGAFLRERAFEAMPEDLVLAANFLRKAAGVFAYLGNNLLQPLEKWLPTERPLEAVPSMSQVMNLICLSEAQMVTIMKAEERRTSLLLLSKLHFGVSQMLDQATSILKSNVGNLKDVSSRLQEFLSLSSSLHQMRSKRRLAEELVAQHKAADASGQLGTAVAILRQTTAKSKAIKSPRDELWRSVLKKEMADMAKTLRMFEHDNEFVFHEKLPDYDQLPILQGKQIVEPTPYQPWRWERHLDFVI